MSKFEDEQSCGFKMSGPNSANICVVPEITGVKTVAADNENVCGNGKSPVNILEIAFNKGEACAFLPDTIDVRLAGGAIISQYNKDCLVDYADSLNYKGVLCADIDR